ncbi:helicase-associated domain-containing protein [Streptomyces sp. MRC013]|uniref:helicase-associated domain-containing protein n=1 Tax=Streptomyces sp. MRC013 TaxID=2898276 RepID=UPI0020275B4F|nr:helicase-associated domain-containing protein [Streptomyces sp. MRC013]URM89615.1 helicase-associated domain-containing protein [Streptomyces sp. MRC013]
MVPGTPSRRLASLLDGLAEREARGTASVWRFTSASLRRALDEGRTAEEIEAGLAEVVEGALPQALTYLIADAARRHGRVRVAPAGCVVHSEDTALVAEIAVRRELSGLGLRRLAPTVLLCRAAPAEALAALRANGYAPAAETEDGAVGVERAVRIRAGGGEGVHAEGPRAAGPSLPGPRRPGEAADARGPVPVADLAGRLLAAPDREPHPDPLRGGPAYGTATEEILDGYAKGLTLTDVRQLAHALDAGEPVTIEYVAASGNRTVRTVSDLEMDPPLLYAYCHLREDDRVFTLSRIQSVLPVQRPPV